MGNLQKDRRRSSERDKFAKANNNFCKNSYSPKIEEIKKFEPSIPSRNTENLSEERYLYIKDLAHELQEYLTCKHSHKSKYQSYLFYQKYEEIIRLISTFKGKNYINVGAIPYELLDQSERDLLTVLYADSKLEYVNLYQTLKDQKQDTNNIQDKFNYQYGFFSYKLIYMELQVAKLNNKINIQNEVKNNQSRS